MSNCLFITLHATHYKMYAVLWCIRNPELYSAQYLTHYNRVQYSVQQGLHYSVQYSVHYSAVYGTVYKVQGSLKCTVQCTVPSWQFVNVNFSITSHLFWGVGGLKHLLTIKVRSNEIFFFVFFSSHIGCIDLWNNTKFISIKNTTIFKHKLYYRGD